MARLLLTGCLLALTAACTGDQDPGLQPADEPARREVSWKRVDAPARSTVTVSGSGSVAVDPDRPQATVSAATSVTVAAPDRIRITDVMVDGRWAVVVRGDTLLQKPSEATVVDLVTGDTYVLDGASDPPTVTDGTWALDGDELVHATTDADGAYCLARRELGRDAEPTAEIGYCVTDRHGFTNLRVGDAGVGLMAFDDSRPSCRTVGVVEGDSLGPQPGVEDCKGWELVPTGFGAIWTVIPKESQIDRARVWATPATSSDSRPVDLGGAAAGSLVWCGDAAYFVRDSSRRSPAQVLRWTGGDQAVVVFEAGKGNAFIDAPRCGGDRLTISVFAETGDRQLSARVG